MILVTGGSRSGKSVFAEELVKKAGPKVLYMATAMVTDEEMADRVRKHRVRRPDTWDTNEGYENLGQVLKEKGSNYDSVLLDCVTTMVTNFLFQMIGEVNYNDFDYSTVDFQKIEAVIINEFRQFLTEAAKADTELVMVTNEIGMGVIPESCLGRAFRDIAGSINQLAAESCDSVYLVVSGIPVKIKG